MYSLNRAQIIGYVTEDPEIRGLSSGVMVTDLNIEIRTRMEIQATENQMATSFLTVTVWRKLAEVVKSYVKKGQQLYLSGRLETDSWEDDHGVKKYKTKIVASELIMLSPKNGFLSPMPDNLLISGGINKAEIIGNVTKDPELKTTPNGNFVSSFGVATNRTWKNLEGEDQEKTEFHNIVVWGDLAEQVSKNIQKGRKVYVSGRIQTRSWETPDGQKRYTTEIIATEVKSLGHSLSGKYTDQVSESTLREEKSTESIKDSSSNILSREIDNIPEINYESEIKPEDLPF